MRKYTSQAILNFQNTTQPSLSAIQFRLSGGDAAEVPIIEMNGVKPVNLAQSLEKLDRNSRLYIDAHGTSENGNKIY